MKSKLFFVVALFLCAVAVMAQDFKILSSNENSILIEYRPNISAPFEIELRGKKFLDFDLDNGLYDDLKPGEPKLPYRAFNVGVPDEFGNTIQIVKSDFKIIRGKVKPFPRLEKVNGFFEERNIDNYTDKYDIPRLVEFGEFGLVRSLPVQTIKVYPIQFEANREEIKVYTNIIFRINFARTAKSTQTYTSAAEIKRLENIVVNFKSARKWLKSPQKSLAKVSKHSLLASGTWYKFNLKEEGIYKISQSDLSKFGLDNSVDPRNIKIYNYGGYELSYSLGDARFDDLHEIPIYVSGQDDGKFDANDFILFYGRGVDFFEVDPNNNKVKRFKNHYSQQNSYFITTEGGSGLRIGSKSSGNLSAAYNQTRTKAFAFIEDDKINIIKSGIDYLGDELNTTNSSATYITTLANRAQGSVINYKIRFVNNSEKSQSFAVYESGQKIYSSFLTAPNGYEVARAHKASFTYSGALENDRSTIKINFNANDIAAKGYLDYLEFQYEKHLSAADDQLILYSKDTTSAVNYTLSNFSNSSIWCFDVTKFDDVKLQQGNISGGQFKFQANEVEGNIRKYFAVNESKFKVVSSAEKVLNSDIHNPFPGAEYLIITHRNFADQAKKLEDYRASGSWKNLSTKIVYIDEIYNEFSSGSLDPTAIRNFLKYAYDNWQIRPFYVLFFGDGDYDYFNVEGHSINFIPSFQTVSSFDEVYSYPYDDYYGRISGNDKKLDLALGRINIQSVGDGEVIVDKIIEYETKSDKGLWRSRITLVADDGLTSKGNDGNIHTYQSETLANFHIPAYFNLNKLYLSAYPTVITGFGRRKPQVNEEIINAVNNGTLLLNFIGHGNPEVWTHEVVFEKTVSIPQMKNEKYTFLTAATCDFGKFDDPTDQSGTEEMLLKYKAGIIGGISAVRPVYSNSNARLAYDYYDFLLGHRDSLFLPRTIGEAYFILKQIRTSTNDEKYHLFGDPALRLNEPHYNVAVDSVNGVAKGQNVSLKALSPAVIKGSIVDNSGKVITSVNGEAIVSVYDSQRGMHLDDINYDIKLQGGLIFRGRATVDNGKFSASFIVPKDISYENKNGKIVVYLLNDSQDGIGFNNDIVVGGTDSTAVNDKKGPEISIYYDDMNFENSYLVNPDFTLLVKLKDGAGLNTTGTGVGHKLEGILNGDSSNPIDFTNYFIGDLDAGGRSGLVNYRFTELPEGDYKIKIKAWDIFNNFSQAEDYFSVVSQDGLVIRDVYNYPNPFSGKTSFTFQHNLNQPMDVKIKIYTIAGRLINEIEQKNILEKFVKIPWDGRDKDGNSIASGTYLYKLIVKSSDGSVNENFLGKLAVIR